MDFERGIHLTSSQSLHLKVLRAVAEQVQDTPYVLKGGSALILTRQMERYTTDIDFDSARKVNLAGRIENALKAINGVELQSLKLVKDTDTVQRYKIHYLHQSSGQDILLKVETSFREQPKPKAIETIAGIKTYRIAYLLEQKLLAAQNRIAARDLFDIAFLIERFGSQLRNDQIESVRQFTADPDRLVEQYRLSFQAEAILSSLTTIEDTVIALQLGIEKLKREQEAKQLAIAAYGLLELIGDKLPDGSRALAGQQLRLLWQNEVLTIASKQDNREILKVVVGRSIEFDPLPQDQEVLQRIPKHFARVQQQIQQQQNSQQNQQRRGPRL